MTGATVYLDRAGGWVEDLQQARVFVKEEADARDAAHRRDQGDACASIRLEIETVTLNDGVIVPDRLRERIRAEGPTAPRFDRQHLDEDGHVSI